MQYFFLFFFSTIPRPPIFFWKLLRCTSYEDVRPTEPTEPNQPTNLKQPGDLTTPLPQKKQQKNYSILSYLLAAETAAATGVFVSGSCRGRGSRCNGGLCRRLWRRAGDALVCQLLPAWRRPGI